VTAPSPVEPAARAAAPAKPYTYTQIPKLKQLLPRMGGRPGVEYAQVCVQHLRDAEDAGWHRVDHARVYTIVGPKGSIDLVLMERGKPVPGLGHASGKRKCQVDLLVEQATGHFVRSKPLVVGSNGATANAVSEPKPQATQARKGDARVESGDAAQR
jgi:hypothetical protein